MEKKLIQVQGMDCTGCEESISKALKRLQGVASCTPSYTDATVEVEFDAQLVGMDTISKAIVEAGYEVAPTA